MDHIDLERPKLIDVGEVEHALLLKTANDFIGGKVDYKFTNLEKMALMPFFTNGNKRVFFVHNLPASIASALLAMYSRLKNERGMRGHFVDNLLPILLCSMLNWQPGDGSMPDDNKNLKKITDYIKDNKLTSLDKFCEFHIGHMVVFSRFLKNCQTDMDFMTQLASSPKISAFLGMYLDSYGHNSIARTANFMIGIEDVSILAAKSLEWGRPGAGYIELSTRYVDFSRRSQYPIEKEFEIIDSVYGSDLAKRIGLVIRESVNMYKQLVGDNFDGLLPRFFRESFRGLIDEKTFPRP